MNVREVSNGSAVKIHATISGHNIVVMTEAIFGVSDGLLVKPMEYFGKFMQFMEPSKVEIRNKRDGRVYKFMSTTITPVKTRYGNFHLIKTTSELEPENARKAERFYIEKLGIMSVNGNIQDLKNCIVHDLSLRGISLILDENTTVKVGDNLDVLFRYGADLHNYEVSTTVVRLFDVTGKKAVGCSIANLNVDLIGLLSAKRNEQQPESEPMPKEAVNKMLDAVPPTNLNPKIPKKQQIVDVEEDIAKSFIPERPLTITIGNKPKNNNPFTQERTIRQQRKEALAHREGQDIADLLNLNDLKNI